MRIKIKIEGGKITLGKYHLKEAVRSAEDGCYSFLFEEWKEKRSLAQNNLYWKWIDILADFHGYEEKAMHEAFLEEFAPIKTVKKLDGSPKQKPVRSSEMNVKQMSEYMNAIDRHAAKFGVELPHPEPEMISSHHST